MIQLLRPTIWRLGVKSLLLHPMRSGLTVLGIFIGIASVIWLLAIGEGISQRVQKQIEELGTNNVILRSVKPISDGELDTSSMAIYGVTREDYKALTKTITSIEDALQIRDAKRELHYGAVDMHVHLIGCTAEYDNVMKLERYEGRFIDEMDVKQKNNVCVLSKEIADYLFPFKSAIGEVISVRDMPYKVVGVMKSRGVMAAVGSSLEAQDFTDDVYIPLDTFWQRIGDWTMERSAGTRTNEVVELSQVTFQVKEMEEVLATADAIESVMRSRHDEKDYAIVTPLELIEQAKTTRLLFMTFMGLIAAISLVVGGIGIMNIMLATVTERTREIGIRRALGANRLAIVTQFLVETVVLSVVGGLLGIVGGLVCPFVVNGLKALFNQWFPSVMAELPTAVNETVPIIVWVSIPIAFGIAVIVGLLFGIYPATRAAQLDPIEALRHE